jgi:hypothetical protein
MAEPIAIVAIITAVGALATITFKYVRHSECLGCFKCDTRTPPESPAAIQAPAPAPPPTPQTHRQRKYAESDSEFDLQIAEIEV